ncbi:ribbon-helix-helix protein, CopG family [Clostridiaceae bacterium M8S5]|nr:ribbon-helix-helix protein, CopG family [Clostridiaceae bacterium M8S5]
MSDKKRGRHTDNPKNHSVRIRMDKITIEKLDKCREVENLNRSEMIRKSISKYYDDLQK